MPAADELVRCGSARAGSYPGNDYSAPFWTLVALGDDDVEDVRQVTLDFASVLAHP